MEPTLVAGQGLIGRTTRRARQGELRCVEHPQRPGFWLVKRVASVDDGGATMRIVSDNVDVDAVDSRVFGPVQVAGSYRVVLRVPRRFM